MILLSSGVGGVKAIKEAVGVPVGYRNLKVVNCGGDGGEAVLPNVLLNHLDAVLAGREEVVGIDSRGVFLD